MDRVTPSESIRSARTRGSPISDPGSTSFDPTIGQAYGRDQALAWNMGTTASTESRLASAMTSAMQAA